MGKRLTLVLGGARSGKSDFAQALALRRGSGEVLFIATAQALDAEMSARIDHHRAARDPRWQTLETPREVARALASAPPTRVVLIDCLTLWTSNVLLEYGQQAEAEVVRELDELVEWHRRAEVELIVVSNEVGTGVVPPSELGRAYRDLLGGVNCKMAALADEVFWLVSGLAIEVKSRAVRLQDL